MTAFQRGLRVFLVLALGGGLVGCAASSPETAAEEPERTVNVGYGTQSADDVAGATDTLRPEEQDRDTATNLSDLLDGRTAGVRVKQTANGIEVTVRGPTTINGGTAPLYVLDGMPIDPRPNGTVPVNPRDVESITVLKDAASSSIYGSRGANGVIVIETKDQ